MKRRQWILERKKAREEKLKKKYGGCEPTVVEKVVEKKVEVPVEVPVEVVKEVEKRVVIEVMPKRYIAFCTILGVALGISISRMAELWLT